MKTILKSTSLFLTATVLFPACSLNEDANAPLSDPGNFWQGYADVSMPGGEGRDFDLVLDDGMVLEVVSLLSPVPADYGLRDGLRGVVNFSKISEHIESGTMHWEVRLNGMQKVLTKTPVGGDGATLADGTPLGNDPINVRRMWLSGKYLNTTFLFKWDDAKVVHGINLWVDREHPGADAQNVYVELRHNARGDGKYYEAFGRVSFDIRELIPEGQNAVTVHFSYTDYAGSRHTVSKLYSLNLSEEPGDLDVSSNDPSNID